MELAIISDTHVPSRATEVPAWVRERVETADHTIHAGDFDSPAAYETVEDLAEGNLTAARGNTDPGSLDLPRTATVEFEGVTFAVTHGTGSPSGYRERVVGEAREAAPGADPLVVVAGHTHEVVDETVQGVRLLNPGSATGITADGRETMMTATVGDGRVGVRLHER